MPGTGLSGSERFAIECNTEAHISKEAAIMLHFRLAQDVWRGTPHIAGHSVQAKNRASLMVYQRLCDYLKIQRRDFKFGVKEPSFLGVEGNFDVLDILNVVHPLRHHTEEIIKMSQLDTPRKVAHFDEYRAKCGLRQEFSAYKAVCSGFDGGIIKTLTGLGFFS